MTNDRNVHESFLEDAKKQAALDKRPPRKVAEKKKKVASPTPLSAWGRIYVDPVGMLERPRFRLDSRGRQKPRFYGGVTLLKPIPSGLDGDRRGIE
jgi:hypothetical protein